MSIIFFIKTAVSSVMTLLVPETSYSSSEGEDDFYDADDNEPFGSQGNSPTGFVFFLLALRLINK